MLAGKNGKRSLKILQINDRTPERISSSFCAGQS